MRWSTKHSSYALLPPPTASLTPIHPSNRVSCAVRAPSPPRAQHTVPALLQHLLGADEEVHGTGDDPNGGSPAAQTQAMRFLVRLLPMAANTTTTTTTTAATVTDRALAAAGADAADPAGGRTVMASNASGTGGQPSSSLAAVLPLAAEAMAELALQATDVDAPRTGPAAAASAASGDREETDVGKTAVWAVGAVCRALAAPTGRAQAQAGSAALFADRVVSVATAALLDTAHTHSHAHSHGHGHGRGCAPSLALATIDGLRARAAAAVLLQVGNHTLRRTSLVEHPAGRRIYLSTSKYTYTPHLPPYLTPPCPGCYTLGGQRRFGAVPRSLP